ncbi:MAG: winged helix-turn-helix domain-containing protein [Chloroflexota bacterium]
MTLSTSHQRQIFVFTEADLGLAHDIAKELVHDKIWVNCCHTLGEASEWVFHQREQPPDMIIIDVPSERLVEGMSAFKFYSLIRRGGWVSTVQQRFEGWQTKVPILMLVDADNRLDVEERMVVLGVQPERIDYKPYRANILLAKINGLLKNENDVHSEEYAKSEYTPIIRIRSMTLNPNTERVLVGARSINLSQLEFRLLFYLASNPDTPLSREVLLEEIWGITGKKAHNNRNADVYIGRLRKKLLGTECADMIGRGHNGSYVLNTDSAGDTFTEPDGTKVDRTHLGSEQPSFAKPAFLIRESDEANLPVEFALHKVKTGAAHHVGIKIGRNGHSVDCVIIDKRISRWHATIFFDQGDFFIRDENSTGYTYLARATDLGRDKRERLTPRTPVRLNSGDLIYFNTVCYQFKSGEQVSR